MMKNEVAEITETEVGSKKISITKKSLSLSWCPKSEISCFHLATSSKHNAIVDSVSKKRGFSFFIVENLKYTHK